VLEQTENAEHDEIAAAAKTEARSITFICDGLPEWPLETVDVLQTAEDSGSKSPHLYIPPIFHFSSRLSRLL
jgi:hypothetical protein